jgi:sugar lactone lactonase YvrE
MSFAASPDPTLAPWRRRLTRTPIIVFAAAATLTAGMSASSSASPRPVAAPTPRAIDDTSVFAQIPRPGHPFGVAVDGDHVYVSTSDGDFFSPHANSNGERVFTYNTQGKLVHTTKITTLPGATMGLNGIAIDGDHSLFVADMNGRVLRMRTDGSHANPKVFAEAPFPFSYGNWGASMWNDNTFDPAGNLYMTDDKPRIWRITPDGQAAVWFQDPRLLGLFGFAGGPLGGRIDPTGKYFYFAVTVSEPFPGDSVVYRLPLVANPAPADLEIVHRFEIAPGEQPGQTSPDATGIAFAKSGNLYVSLTGRNEIAVLDPAGNLIRTISSPLFDTPWGLAFSETSLLVTNASIRPEEQPDKWLVLSVNVGEEGLPLNRPNTGD